MSILAQSAAALLWLATVGMMIVKTPRSVTTFYRLQALADAVIAAAIAVQGHQPLLWIAVGLAVIVRVGLIPEIVRRGLTTGGKAHSAKTPVGLGGLMMYALGLSAGGILLGRMGVPDPTVTGLVFASMFVSFMHLSARYEVWSMLWALLSLDTIVDVGVVIFGRSIPATVDVALYAVSLGLALVLAFVARRIQDVHSTLDVRDLEELIG
jgi:hydrogenase-4 membrane subunit HyfE